MVGLKAIRWAIVLWIIGSIVFVSGASLMYFLDYNLLFYISIGIYVLCGINYFRATRCPHCKEPISVRVLLKTATQSVNCPKCNHEIIAKEAAE